MKARMNKTLIGILAVGLCTLTGCSGEPSQQQVEAAVQKNVDEANNRAKQLAGKLSPDMQTKLNSAKKVACTKESDKVYKCDVEIDMNMPMAGELKKTVSSRFVNGSDGWTVSE